MGNGDIIRPDEDVDIGYAFSGAIRCRNLTVLEGGSVTGTVVASRVDVKGSLNGVVDCEYFQALPPAFVRGTVFAPNCLTRDKDGRTSDALFLYSSKRQAIFHLEPPQAPINFEELISTAIEEAVAERVAPAAASAIPEASMPASPVETTSETPSERELGLLERLASKGLTSLLPADPEPEELLEPVPTPLPSDRAATSGRTPLPSLV
jgi:hypothetical protein